MKAIMISIKPEWVEKILNGEKTIEIRKTRPNIELPCKVYIYKTKGKGKFVNCGKKRENIGGKVVAEFTLNKITKHEKNYIDVEDRLCYNFLSEDVKNAGFYIGKNDVETINALCDFDNFVENYGNGKPLYAWHINDLKIYDTPKDLMQFLGFINCSNCNSYKYKPQNERFNMCNRCKEFRTITRPPQSWCYVEEEI